MTPPEYGPRLRDPKRGRALDEIARQDQIDKEASDVVRRTLRLYEQSDTATRDDISPEFVLQEKEKCRTRILSDMKDLKDQLESGELERIMGQDGETVSQLFRTSVDETPEMCSLRDKLDKCHLEISEKDVKMTRLETQYRASEDKVSSTKVKYHTLRTSYNTLTTEHNEALRTHNNCSREMTATAEKLARYEGRMEDLSNTVAKQSQQLRSQRDWDTEKIALQTKAAQAASLEQQNKTLQDTVNDLRQRMQEADASEMATGKQLNNAQDHFNNQIQQQKDLLAAEKRVNVDWQKKFEQSRSEVRRLERAAFKANDDLGEAQDRCSQSEFDLQLIRTEHRRAISQVQQHVDEINLLDQRAKQAEMDREEALSGMQNRAEAIQTKLALSQEMVHAKSRENNQLQSAMQTLQEEQRSQNKARTDEALKLKQELCHLKDNLKTKQEQYELSIGNLETEKAELQGQLSTAESNTQELTMFNTETIQKNVALEVKLSDVQDELRRTKESLQQYENLLESKYGSFREMKQKYSEENEGLTRRLDGALEQSRILTQELAHEREVASSREDELMGEIDTALTHEGLLNKELDNMYGTPGVDLFAILGSLYNIRCDKIDLKRTIPAPHIDFRRVSVMGMDAELVEPVVVPAKLLTIRRRLILKEFYDAQTLQVLLDLWRTLGEPDGLLHEDQQRLYLAVHDLSVMVLEQTESLVAGTGPLIAWIIVEILSQLACWECLEGKWEDVRSCVTRLLDRDVPVYVQMSLLRLRSLTGSLLKLSEKTALTYMEAFELATVRDDAMRGVECQTPSGEEVRVDLIGLADTQFALLKQKEQPLILILCAGHGFTFRVIGFRMHLVFQLHGQTQAWPLSVPSKYRSWFASHPQWLGPD